MVNDKGPPKEKTKTSKRENRHIRVEEDLPPSREQKFSGVDPLSVDKVPSMHKQRILVTPKGSQWPKIPFKAPTKDHSDFEGTVATVKGSQ